MEARFWTFAHGSPVRVKLTPARPLQWWTEGRTDEGWAAEGERWRLDGDTIVRESHSDGRDCDGRYASFGVSVARVDRLSANEVDGLRYPDWSPIDGHHRDYSAEASGY